MGVAANTSLPKACAPGACSTEEHRGPEAKSVAADLQKLKGDASAAVRRRAAEAIERMSDRTTPVTGRTAVARRRLPSRNTPPPATRAEAERRG